MKKNQIFMISIIIIFLVIIISLLIYITSLKIKINDEITIEAKVLATGEDYLLVTTEDDIDYIISTNNTKYGQGDTLKLELTNIHEEKIPIEATAKNITLIKEKEQITIDNDNVENNSSANTEKEEQTEKSNENKVQEDNIDNTTTNNNEIKNSDESSIISYFETLDTELANYKEGNNSSTLKSKFVKCIDFIFYDGEINGKTFNELSSNTKLKVISLALSINNKIDSKFSNYKESISTSYQNIKSKLIEKYLDITTTICQKDNELCITAKEGFSNLKANFKVTWQMIKDLAGTGTTKLKNWYEIWRYQ